MLESPPSFTLYTFSISHFSEKIRWTLDASAIPYREVRLTPVFHVATMLRLGQKKTTVPVLKTELGFIQDSTRILEWLEANRAPLALIPRAAALRNEAMAIEARFDNVGDHALRYLYGHALPERKAVVRMWTLDGGTAERVALSLAFPAIRAGFQRARKIGPRYAEESACAIHEELDWLASRIRERRYLVGDSLSIADIAAASIVAPIACPDEHPVYGSAHYRSVVRLAVARWERHPAIHWVRDLYALARHDTSSPCLVGREPAKR